MLHNNFHHNFYKYKIKHKYYKWYWFNGILGVFILAYITYYQMNQIIIYNQAYKEYQEIETFIYNQKDIIKQHKQLKNSIHSLEKKLQDLSSYCNESLRITKNNSCRIDTVLISIAQMIPNKTRLESISYNHSKKNIKISGFSKSYKSLSKFIENLHSHSEFHNIAVTDIHTKNKKNLNNQELEYTISINIK